MKTIVTIAGVIFLLSISPGCSAPAYVQKDDSFNPSSVKTYMWVNTMPSQNDESKRATAYADIEVHNTVNAELAKWGWREVTENPDVVVSYDVFVERTTQTQTNPVYTQSYTRY